MLAILEKTNDGLGAKLELLVHFSNVLVEGTTAVIGEIRGNVLPFILKVCAKSSMGRLKLGAAFCEVLRRSRGTAPQIVEGNLQGGQFVGEGGGYGIEIGSR